MLLEPRQFFDGAWEHYRSQEHWRQKQKLIDELRFSQSDLHVPDAILKTQRSQPVYAFLAHEIMGLFGNLMDEKDGPLITVSAYGISTRSLTDRDVVQGWCTGQMQRQEEDQIDGLRKVVHQDLGVRGWTLVRVLPNNAWRDMPIVDAMREDESLDEYKARVEDVADAQEVFRRSVNPIDFQWVPALGAVVVEQQRRLKEVWEFREMTIPDVRAAWMALREPSEDEDASALEEAAKSVNTLTNEYVVTVVSRADAEHLQFGICPFTLDTTYQDRTDAKDIRNVEEIIWQGPHLMGTVPYSFFPGRVTNSNDPVLRYAGFLDPVIQLIQRYDELLTQLYSMCRIAAWPMLVEEVQVGGLGTGDNAPAIELEEGGIVILPAGHKLSNPQWTNTNDLQSLLRAIQLLRHEIGLKTFPEAAFGAADTASGYQQSLVQNAAESGMAEFQKGANKGWSGVLRLAVRAARALISQGSGPIPVKLVGDDGAEYVTLRKEQAFKDWDISVKVNLQPIGGEAALMNTLANEINAGLLSRQTAMERLGIRNPSREMKRILLEQVYSGQAVVQQLQQLFLQRSMALALQETSKPPTNPTISQGLASATTNPDLRMLIPGQNALPATGAPNAHIQNGQAPPPAGTGVAPGQQPQAAGVGGPAAGNPAGAGGAGSFQRAAEGNP